MSMMYVSLIQPDIVSQIVREQCWLNEILTGFQWSPEGPASHSNPAEPEQVTEEELQAILSGEILPHTNSLDVGPMNATHF